MDGKSIYIGTLAAEVRGMAMLAFVDLPEGDWLGVTEFASLCADAIANLNSVMVAASTAAEGAEKAALVLQARLILESIKKGLAIVTESLPPQDRHRLSLDGLDEFERQLSKLEARSGPANDGAA